MKYDFAGWATKYDIRCSDGNTIAHGAFSDCDGKIVPLVYNHGHKDPESILGRGKLECRPEGVYVYGEFNNGLKAQQTKEAVMHGDITALSIYANKLSRHAKSITHGVIREVSLCLAGANDGAVIEYPYVQHSDGTYEDVEDEAIIYGEDQELIVHSDDGDDKDEEKDEKKMDEGSKKADSKKTVKDVLDTLNEEQRIAVQAAIAYAVEHAVELKGGSGKESTPKEDEDVAHNVFENNSDYDVITHSDQTAIMELAHDPRCGSFKTALAAYYDDNSDTLAHSIDEIDSLFPEWHDTNTGEPKTLKRDLTWVDTVMNGVRKSPFSRIRTRHADARGKELRAKGYIKGDEKTVSGNVKLLKRTTDPQTIIRKDALERDDIVDITDFDVVSYMWGIMKENLEEDIAMAILLGDDRDEDDRTYIKPEHIRPIWTDDDQLFTIHVTVDFDAAKRELQGTDTAKHFSDNYIYAEEILKQILYAKEKYKGSGNLTMFCTPHLVNQMLLARDLNGRRIYNNVSDLTSALNVSKIVTVEQFEGRTRTTNDNKTMKILALLVNLSDYQVGSTKGGEITKFNQFDIDFNQEKMMMETRLSGALTEWFSAIALEEEVTE